MYILASDSFEKDDEDICNIYDKIDWSNILFKIASQKDMDIREKEEGLRHKNPTNRKKPVLILLPSL